MPDTTQKEQQPNATRRSVLKSTAGLTVLTLGFGSAVETVAADPEKFDQGSVHFVEVKEEHPNAKGGPETSRHGTAGYVVEPSRNRLTLTTAPVETLTNNSLITAADGAYYPQDSTIQVTKSKYALPIKTDYRQVHNRYIALDEAREPPTLSVEPSGNDVRVHGDAHRDNVPAGDTVTLQRSGVTVNPANSSAGETVTRQVSIRNHGKISVFGHEDYLVLPLNSDDGYAKARVSSLLALTQDGLSKMEDADLLAVPKGATYSAPTNGGM